MSFEQILRPVAEGFKLLGNVVNPNVYPFSWHSTLHAARVSLAFQSNTHRLGTHAEHGWKSYIGGFLLMSWGGMIFSHLLLSLPPPVIYTSQPWINYISVHLLLTRLFSSFPSIPVDTEVLSMMDVALFPLDAMLRANAIVGAMAHLAPGSPSYNSVNPVLINSTLFHFILGCTASSGGGVSAATLGVWNPNWGLDGITPVFLRKGPGSLFRNASSTLDVWAGGVVAIVYGLSTSHPAFRPLITALSPYISAFFLIDITEIKPLSSLGGKSIAALILMTLFGVRALAAKFQPTVSIAAKDSGKGRKKQ